LRNVEFFRDWSLPYDTEAADEHIARAGLQVADSSGNHWQYELMYYNRSGNYQGWRNKLQTYNRAFGWQLSSNSSYMVFDRVGQKGFFLRPDVEIKKSMAKLYNFETGLKYSGE